MDGKRKLSHEGKEYIERRGWAPRDYKDIGVYSDGDFVYFPLKDWTGNPIGAIGRNIKYKTYNIKIHKSVHGYFLWPGIDSDRVLFLVEGVFDVGWLLASGFHAAAYINNTLLGAQLRIISRFYEKVVIIPDNDPEGLLGSTLAVNRLKKMGVPHVRDFKLKYHKDVCETFEKHARTAEQLVEVLAKIEMSWDDAFPDRIEPNSPTT